MKNEIPDEGTYIPLYKIQEVLDKLNSVLETFKEFEDPLNNKSEFTSGVYWATRDIIRLIESKIK